MAELLTYKEVPLGGQYSYLTTKVSPEDYDNVMRYIWCGSESKHSGSICVFGYITEDQRGVYLSRFILDAQKDVYVDHKNMDTLDNTRENLRVCTNSQNGANSLSRGGTSDYKGVSWYKPRERWQAQIMKNYKCYHLGLFDSELDAAQAYDKAAVKYFGEFARLNFPFVGGQNG